MWNRYTRPCEGDKLNRDDWFIIRTEEAADGRVTLVLVDFAAGANADATRCEMADVEAKEMAEETAAELLSEGWSLAEAR
ncbi:hypothetical protein ACGFYT_29935 [Streptomyces sp. NPDC048208]|uniref:hypothetical protein n=1 Tax=Streptomyces sp. NPDC048208 TaxID=3365515 RepID=UPI00371856F4